MLQIQGEPIGEGRTEGTMFYFAAGGADCPLLYLQNHCRLDQTGHPGQFVSELTEFDDGKVCRGAIYSLLAALCRFLAKTGGAVEKGRKVVRTCC